MQVCGLKNWVSDFFLSLLSVNRQNWIMHWQIASRTEWDFQQVVTPLWTTSNQAVKLIFVLGNNMVAGKLVKRGRPYSIGGDVKPGFELVREEFEKGFKLGLERDAQICVYVGTEVVVDLWGTTTVQQNNGNKIRGLQSDPPGPM